MNRYDLAENGEYEGLWDWNLTTNRVHFSPRWISMLGCEEQEVGRTPEEWFRRIHPEDSPGVRQIIEACLVNGSPRIESQHRLLHKDGTYRWMHCRGIITRDETGQAVRIVGSHSDVTAGKVVDALTGLPNRLLLLDRLTRSIMRTRRRNDFLFAVLLLDLDRFSSLNERLGVATGDHLLIAAARRLETCLRAGDTVARIGRDHLIARLGGDEFIILIEGLNEVGEARIVAERLLMEISAPFELDSREVFVSASIGIALSVTGYDSPEAALRDADIAMYRAKSLGKARCEVFDTAMLESACSRLELEADLQGALGRQEFLILYQPIMNLASNRIAGFEALVRWNHPVRGTVSPMEFIPVAERIGLIVPLGRWVLKEACGQLKAWQEKLGIQKELWVSVNFSGLQFAQRSLAEEVGQMLTGLQLEPHCLVIEVTESMMMENPQAVSSLLMQLRVMGIQIALDDFGTGHSSLGYLRHFPADLLKVDHSFVRSLASSQDDLEIIRAIRNLAKQLGLRTVAEGIENSDQLDLVRSLNFEFGQGYLFSRPVNAESAEELLRSEMDQLVGLEPEAQSGGSVALGVESSREIPLSVSTESFPGEQLRAQREGRTIPRRRLLSFLLAGLMLILAGATIARLHRRDATPASGQDSRLDGRIPPVTSPAAVKLEAPADKQGVIGRKQARGSQALGAAQVPGGLVQTAKKDPQACSLAVIHNHLLGSCKGTLKLSAESLSFVSEKEKDSFRLAYDDFSCAVPDDSLTIKSGSKSYRFKSAEALNKDENRLQLQNIYRKISGNQRLKAESGKQ